MQIKVGIGSSLDTVFLKDTFCEISVFKISRIVCT